jgi:D-3-phosphoglycerate dehydrogenase
MGFIVVNTVLVPGMNFGEDLLKPLGATLVSGNWNTEDELIANAKDADGVICAGPSQPWTSRVLTALSRCRIVSTLSIGYDRIHVETATKMGIVVTNLPDYCIDEVSSQAIAFIMALGAGCQ